MARTRWRRVLVGAGLVVGGALGLALVGVGGGVLWLRSSAGNRWLTERLVYEVHRRQTEGDFVVGSIDTDLLGRAVLRDVELTDGQGRVLLGADRLVLSYDLWPLLGKEVQLDYVEADGLVVDLHADERGLLDLQRVFGKKEPSPKSTDPWAGLPVQLDVDELRLQGATVTYTADRAGGGAPIRWAGVGINAAAAIHGSGTRIEVQDIALSGVLTAPYAMPVVARGTVVYTGEAVAFDQVALWLPESKLGVEGEIAGLGTATTFDLLVDADPFDLDLVERLITAKKDFRGRVAGPLAITGPTNALNFKGPLVGVDGTPGKFGVDLTLDTTADGLPFKGTLDVEQARVDALYATPGNELELNGRLVAEGKLSGWPDTFYVKGRYEGGRTVLVRPEKEQILEFDRLSGDIEIERGVLTFTGVEGRGPIGEIGADGTLNLVTGELATDVGGEIVLDILERLGFEDLGGGGSVTVQVTGNVFAEDLPLSASGVAVLAPFVYRGGDVTFERVVARFRWWMRGQTQHVDADVVAERGDLYGLRVEAVHSPNVVVELPPSGEILVTGVARADELVYPDAFTVTTADLAYDVLVPPVGGNQAKVQMTVGPHELVGGFPGTEGTVGIVLNGDDVAYDVDLVANGREFVTATGTYGMVSELVVLDELVFAPTPRQRWVGEGQQRFVVAEGGVHDADISVVSDLGRVEVQGDVATEGPLDGAVLTEGLSLDVFAELFPESFGGLSGELDLQLGLEGRADDPRLSAEIEAEALWLPGFSRWLDVSGHVEGTRERLDLDVAIGAAGEELAVIQGFLPVDLDLADPKLDVDGSVDVQVALRPGSLARLEWLSEEELGLPAGRISAVLEAEGRLGDPDFHLTGVVEAEVEGWDERGRAEFDVDRSGDTLAWWSELREGYDLRGEIAGQGRTRVGEAIAWAFAEEGTVAEPDWDDWTLYVDDLNARVAALGTPVESLLALAGSDVEAGGELLGGFVITGSPMTPEISGGVNWIDGSLGDVPVPGGFVSFVPGEGGYQLDVTLEFENEGSLVASGLVPIAIDLRTESDQWAAGDLDVAVQGVVPLALLAAFDPGIQNASGAVALSGHVGGDANDPEPQGTFALADGVVEYVPFGVRYQDIDLDLTFDKDRITLANLSMTSEPIQTYVFQAIGGALSGEDSSLRVAGTAALSEWEPRDVDLRVVASHFDVSARSDQLLKLSAEAKATGDWPRIAVVGSATVDQGLFVYDAAEFTGGAPLELHEDLVVHRPGAEAPIEAPEPDEPPLWANFDVRVALDLNRAMEVRAELPFVEDYGTLGALVSTVDFTARLGSRDLQLTVRDGEIALLNEVEIVEGQAGVFSSVFDVSGGTLTFLGDPSNPLLGIEAEMRLSTGSVEMSIQGPADDPEIAFSSSEYPDQTEIFTILLTGGTPEEWSAGGGPGEDVAALFGGVFVDSILGNAASQTFTVDPDGTVRSSIPISRDVRAQFLLAPLATQDENVTTFAIDVSLLRQLRLEAAFGNERSWADVYWEYRF